ncbi:MAG: hypothetical protein JSW66_05935 [Phycisphaerales bacterium]|nr:MAG: hypothetical protein JSW66_05935 [Phycisphaerales bacterium]
MSILAHRLLPLMVFCFSSCVFSQSHNEHVIENDQWAITVDLQTLQMTARFDNGVAVELSKGQSGLGKVSSVSRFENQLRWALADKGLTVELSLDGNELTFDINAREIASLTWPVTPAVAPIKALILPRAEGIYVPLNIRRWTDYLVNQGEWNTLEHLSMPFWGFDCDEYCLTWIAANPFNNAMTFNYADNSLQIDFTHRYTRFNREMPFGYRILLSKPRSPIEPARQFRQYLIKNNRFVDLQQKAQRVPRVNRLKGAAHVYLWGDGLFSRHNIPRAQWKPFCQALIKQSEAAELTPGKRIKQLLTEAQWREVGNLVKEQWPNNYQKDQIATAISDMLGHRDFYREGYFQTDELDKPPSQTVEAWCTSAPIADVCKMNCRLLNSNFKGVFTPMNTWGNGASLAMLDQFQATGLDRLRLCVAGWEGVEKRPETAKKAEEMGYLFGTYDSYHSIHDPASLGTDRTWPTAQFDQTLYNTGRILKSDGTPRGGFKGIGAKLSPVAARPYVENRVRHNMQRVPYSYYFIDCDAYGEYYDDYTADRLLGQADDARARIDRLSWISNTFKVPIGSEGGCHIFAPTIHVSEGIFGPLFGWGDPDHENRQSPYYLGAYYPPDGPAVFIKQVPMKETYRFFQYDLRFRLPLFEIVYHDSVVTTHHWANASLKFSNMLDTVALTELLYLVPPLYHLNLDEFAKHKNTIARHYTVFSPLHSRFGFAPMTDFQWLSDDRLVQGTTFGDQLEIVANFSQASYTHRAHVIPARSILAYHKNTGESMTYTP